jgi:hypothetical protein
MCWINVFGLAAMLVRLHVFVVFVFVVFVFDRVFVDVDRILTAAAIANRDRTATIPTLDRRPRFCLYPSDPRGIGDQDTIGRFAEFVLRQTPPADRVSCRMA